MSLVWGNHKRADDAQGANDLRIQFVQAIETFRFLLGLERQAWAVFAAGDEAVDGVRRPRPSWTPRLAIEIAIARSAAGIVPPCRTPSTRIGCWTTSSTV